MKKKAIGIFFFAFLVEVSISAQMTDIEVMSEELIKWKGTNYNILHIYIDMDPNMFTDKSIIKEICNSLQRSEYLSSVDLYNLKSIDYKQFNLDMEFSDWTGGHPIFEWWNNSCEWHIIQFKEYVYLIKGKGYDGFIYKAKITD